MLYGERLKLAMDWRSRTSGQVVARKDIARVADCKVQNVGMILNNAKGVDQKLSTQSHLAVAEYLQVNSDWLLNEVGPMEKRQPKAEPVSGFSNYALDLAKALDKIADMQRKLELHAQCMLILSGTLVLSAAFPAATLAPRESTQTPPERSRAKP